MDVTGFLAGWLAWIPRSEQAEFLRDFRAVMGEHAAIERRRLVTDRDAYEAACAEVEAEVRQYQTECHEGKEAIAHERKEAEFNA